MTNDKATRQAIYGALLRHVDKFGQYSDIQKTIDEVISRLSELQPVNQSLDAAIEDYICTITDNGILTKQDIIEQNYNAAKFGYEFAKAEQPVNKTDNKDLLEAIFILTNREHPLFDEHVLLSTQSVLNDLFLRKMNNDMINCAIRNAEKK